MSLAFEKVFSSSIPRIRIWLLNLPALGFASYIPFVDYSRVSSLLLQKNHTDNFCVCFLFVVVVFWAGTISTLSLAVFGQPNHLFHVNGRKVRGG